MSHTTLETSNLKGQENIIGEISNAFSKTIMKNVIITIATKKLLKPFLAVKFRDVSTLLYNKRLCTSISPIDNGVNNLSSAAKQSRSPRFLYYSIAV